MLGTFLGGGCVTYKIPMHGLSQRLGLLTVWCLGFQKKCPKSCRKQDGESARPDEPGLYLKLASESVTLTIFCCLKQSQDVLKFKGVVNLIPPLMGGGGDKVTLHVGWALWLWPVLEGVIHHGYYYTCKVK